MKTIIEQIQEKEEELKYMKENHKTEIIKHEKENEAREFFRKNFSLYISDDYDIYPEEYTQHVEGIFVREMWDINIVKKRLERLEKSKQEYLTFIKDDIEQLQKEYDRVKKEVENDP